MLKSIKFIARRGPYGLGCGQSHFSKALPNPSPVQVGLRQCSTCGMVLRKKHVLRALDPIHHLRIALGAFKTSPIKSLYAEAGEPSLEHRRIRGDENVDKLAKAALNIASWSGKLICWSDLKPKVNAYIHTVWQENWDANKLHEVLPNLGEDPQQRTWNRQKTGDGNVVMCRFRVDHTWLTQSYLLKEERRFATPVTAFTLSGIF
ncbi:ribonuclease hi [Plakobranchus ocellatus]|uniref:Ribonuclease hi n=1 Tax=Plakobranchus ocellatus TaxID=259542 RepID=A0AAV3YP64_9GAST|nr:ribonuclease hi [Plakobranchus ocellatus]